MKTAQILALLLIGMAVACAQDNASSRNSTDEALGPGEIAVVNGERIPESVYRLFTLAALQTTPDNLSAEDREQVIDRLIFMYLMANEAEKRGLDRERRIAAELELQRLQILARYMTNRYSDENPPSEAELRAVYDESLPGLLATQYKTRHILVESEADAKKLINQIKGGADFAELAKKNSTDSTAGDGGDLGWITVDSVVEPFAEAVKAAIPGTVVSNPIQTQYGWHVILVEEKKENAAPGLDAVRQDITVAAQTKKLTEFVDKLRKEANVQVLDTN